MVSVRKLDGDDWSFGKGKNSYLSNNLAIMQNIKTRLNSFLGNCFFDMATGINWFGLLGTPGISARSELNLSITNTILNTAGVIGLLQISTELTSKRNFTVTYRVRTVYSVTSDTFSLNQIPG
jgi:hypothetical protein